MGGQCGHGCEGDFLALLALAGGCGESVNKEVAAACRDGLIDAPTTIDHWIARGVVIDIGRRGLDSVHVDVDTQAWARIGRKAQISIALAAYCGVADDRGIGKAFVRGNLQEELGAVLNGNWSR